MRGSTHAPGCRGPVAGELGEPAPPAGAGTGHRERPAARSSSEVESGGLVNVVRARYWSTDSAAPGTEELFKNTSFNFLQQFRESATLVRATIRTANCGPPFQASSRSTPWSSRTCRGLRSRCSRERDLGGGFLGTLRGEVGIVEGVSSGVVYDVSDSGRG